MKKRKPKAAELTHRRSKRAPDYGHTAADVDATRAAKAAWIELRTALSHSGTAVRLDAVLSACDAAFAAVKNNLTTYLPARLAEVEVALAAPDRLAVLTRVFERARHEAYRPMRELLELVRGEEFQ